VARDGICLRARQERAKGTDQQQTLPHLKPALRGILKRVYKDVAAAGGALERLQSFAAAIA